MSFAYRFKRAKLMGDEEKENATQLPQSRFSRFVPAGASAYEAAVTYGSDQ
jgi:hypothetical protein